MTSEVNHPPHYTSHPSGVERFGEHTSEETEQQIVELFRAFTEGKRNEHRAATP